MTAQCQHALNISGPAWPRDEACIAALKHPRNHLERRGDIPHHSPGRQKYDMHRRQHADHPRFIGIRVNADTACLSDAKLRGRYANIRRRCLFRNREFIRIDFTARRLQRRVYRRHCCRLLRANSNDFSGLQLTTQCQHDFPGCGIIPYAMDFRRSRCGIAYKLFPIGLLYKCIIKGFFCPIPAYSFHILSPPAVNSSDEFIINNCIVNCQKCQSWQIAYI